MKLTEKEELIYKLREQGETFAEIGRRVNNSSFLFKFDNLFTTLTNINTQKAHLIFDYKVCIRTERFFS